MSILDLVRRAGNDALNVNRPVAVIDITTAASDFLWAIFSVMALSTIVTAFWAHLKIPHGQRTFHHLSMMITGIASIAYFCMASDLGATPVTVEFVRGSYPGVQNITRSIWYARYIDWTLTTPLLLLSLLLVTGLTLSDIVITIFADLVMIITGLIGSLVPSTYKWGLYTFGCVAMFYVFYMLYVPGRKASKNLGPEAAKAYMVGAVMLSFLWFLYPIAWGLADGGNVISPTGEMIFYGVLDLLAKPVFALVHLFALRKIDYNALKLNSGKYSEYSGLQGDVPATGAGARHAHTAVPTSTSKIPEKTTEGELAAAPAIGSNGPDSTVHGH